MQNPAFRTIWFSTTVFFLAVVLNFSMAIHLKPDSPQALNNRGSLYVEKGQIELAIHDFDEAIRLRPDYADALRNRAIASKRTREQATRASVASPDRP